MGYLVNNMAHTNYDPSYMQALGLEPEVIQSILRQRAFELNQLVDKVKSECTRRIEAKWNSIGQLNVALGLYSESECSACIHWINAHRQACDALLVRGDLEYLDITLNEYWPAIAPD